MLLLYNAELLCGLYDVEVCDKMVVVVCGLMAKYFVELNTNVCEYHYMIVELCGWMVSNSRSELICMYVIQRCYCCLCEIQCMLNGGLDGLKCIDVN